MNYRHAYHAGNFADVFKHLIVIASIQALQRKDKGICYLDTHAGAGIYDLLSAHPQKSREYEAGFAKILIQPNPPELVQTYLRIVASLNTVEKPLRFYPGSPYFVKQLLRQQDRMVLSELHPDEYALLKKALPHYKQVGIHHVDGYQALKAFLPPPERRGLVLIDPPYEKTDELMQLIPALATALERFATGVFAVWYPIKEFRSIERFQQALAQRIDRPILATECSLHAPTLATHLNGSGMVIINPPYQLDADIKTFLPWLWETLSPRQQGRHSVYMLNT